MKISLLFTYSHPYRIYCFNLYGGLVALGCGGDISRDTGIPESSHLWLWNNENRNKNKPQLCPNSRLDNWIILFLFLKMTFWGRLWNVFLKVSRTRISSSACEWLSWNWNPRMSDFKAIPLLSHGASWERTNVKLPATLNA